MNKKIILAAVALVALIAVFLGVWVLTRPETSQGSKSYTVTVIHSDGTKKDFTYRTDREFLAEALTDVGLLEGDITQYGLTVHTVDGEKADWNVNKSYWGLYINGEYAMTGASETPVHDGDHFTWEYTIG